MGRYEELLDKAAKGLTPAQIELGHSYTTGKDFDGNVWPRDSEKAKYWLERAHERGASTATVMLGKLYEEGSGIAVDISKAIEYYELAVKNNAFMPCLYIARIHAANRMDPDSVLLASTWYAKVLSFENEVDDELAMEEARNYLATK